MPVTRAALRSNTSTLDIDGDTTTAKPATAISGTNTNTRPVLGEVTGNSEPPSTISSSNALTAAREPISKGPEPKKGKADILAKKISGKSRTAKVAGDTAIELPEKENQSLNKKAVDEIPEALLSEGRQKGAVCMHDIASFTSSTMHLTNAASTGL